MLKIFAVKVISHGEQNKLNNKQYKTISQKFVYITNFITHTLPEHLTFLVCEYLHLATEHGLEQRVLSCEHLHGGIEKRAPDVQPDILIADADGPPVTAGLRLRTGDRRHRYQRPSLCMQRVEATLRRHVPLEVDHHPADDGPDVSRRGDCYWGGCRSLFLPKKLLISAYTFTHRTEGIIHHVIMTDLMDKPFYPANHRRQYENQKLAMVGDFLASAPFLQ